MLIIILPVEGYCRPKRIKMGSVKAVTKNAFFRKYRIRKYLSCQAHSKLTLEPRYSIVVCSKFVPKYFYCMCTSLLPD